MGLPVHEGRENLWAKTKAAHLYLHQHHLQEADWFLKADDDTYVVVENLRYMLQPHNSSAPVYFGCKFKPYVKQGYMSGGAGYVLSREALRRLATRGLADQSGVTCRTDDGGAEDVEMGKCMEALGVTAGDSRWVVTWTISPDTGEKSSFDVWLFIQGLTRTRQIFPVCARAPPDSGPHAG